MSLQLVEARCDDCKQSRPLYPFTCTCHRKPRRANLCTRCYSAASLEEEAAEDELKAAA